MPIGIITNLNSRKNKKGTWRGDRLRRFLSNDGIVRETRDLSEVRGVVEEFIERGCRYWVADGGDGTLHWLMNVGRDVLKERGMWNGGASYPMLVPTSGGTIDFVARKAGIRGSPDEVIRSLVDSVRAGKEPPYVELDTIEIKGYFRDDPEDSPGFKRIGFAAALGGIGQRFFKKYYESRNPNAWTILEVCLKVSAGQIGRLPVINRLPFPPESLRDYAADVVSGTDAEVVIDGRVFPRKNHQGLHVSSIDIDFGTVKLFCYARKPRKLHAVVGDLKAIDCTYKWLYMVMGKPIPGENWYELPAEKMSVKACGNELLNPVVDGELYYGLRRVDVELGPKVRIPVIASNGKGI